MTNKEKELLNKYTKEELIKEIQMLKHHIFNLTGQVIDLKRQIKKMKYKQ